MQYFLCDLRVISRFTDSKDLLLSNEEAKRNWIDDLIASLFGEDGSLQSGSILFIHNLFVNFLIFQISRQSLFFLRKKNYKD